MRVKSSFLFFLILEHMNYSASKMDLFSHVSISRNAWCTHTCACAEQEPSEPMTLPYTWW